MYYIGCMYPVAYPMAKPPHTVWQTLLATSYYVMLRHQETMAKDVCRWRGGHYVRGPTAERNDEHHQAQEKPQVIPSVGALLVLGRLRRVVQFRLLDAAAHVETVTAQFESSSSYHSFKR
jgi:hypothetical protein